MESLAYVRAVSSILRAPRMRRADLRALQNRKLRRVVRHACRYVPYYRRMFKREGLTEDSIQSVEDLQRLPVTTKRDLISSGTDIYSTRYSMKEVVTRRTTGSTGEPMTMRFDRRFEVVRQGLFLRALLATGYRPGQRFLMMKTGRLESSPKWLRWDSLAFDQVPASMVEKIERFRPSIVYGWVTPLRALAEHILDSGVHIGGVRAVVTTAEALDPESRNLLWRAFGAVVSEFYGLTEMGTVAWPCPTRDGLHLSEDVAYVEFEDSVASGGQRMMVMTNLELTAMPLIRYVSGDLAAAHSTADCECGRRFRRISQIGGRSVDCLKLPDGRLVSPYSVTLALESIEGLGRYHVVQSEPSEVLIHYERGEGGNSDLGDKLHQAMRELVGQRVCVKAKRVDRIAAPAGKKFRLVESRVGI